ncbi:feS assembly protein SufD [Clostridium sp. CAG:609]|nr:feS assembly protein SufD [Clostridium sp. CAG:609]
MNKDIYINDLNIKFDIKKGETLNIYHYVFNKNVNVIINLNGENAKVNYHFSVISLDDITFKIKVNHNSKNTESNIFNHGVNVLNNKLSFDVTGLVPKDISKCICNQENQIINLSDGTSLIKPNLLIRNYDTFSNHAAYIGKFKDELLFYLMSRGISFNKSNELLMESLLINNGNKEEKVVQEFIKNLKEVNNG